LLLSRSFRPTFLTTPSSCWGWCSVGTHLLTLHPNVGRC
jgi:hypothetical protein